MNENGGGWLNDRMKKKRGAIHKQRKKEEADQTSEGADAAGNGDIDVEIDFEILKATVITDESMDFIKEKLVRTQHYRQQMLSNLNMHLIECFPYFFVRPELVCVYFLMIQVVYEFIPFLFLDTL